MNGCLPWLGIWAFALTVTALICIAVSWWTSGDPWWIFVQLTHSYHGVKGSR